MKKILIPMVLVSLLLISSASASLVGHWAFNETSGTNAYDSSGNGNNGTLYNFTDTYWVTGQYGNALKFDGENDFVNFGNDSSLNFSSDFSITFWVKNYDVLYDGYPLDKYLSTGGDPEVGIMIYGRTREGSADLEWSIVDVDENSLDGDDSNIGGNTYDGTWHFVAIVKNSTHGITWLDDEHDAVEGSIGDINNIADMIIGAEFNENSETLGGFYNGTLDEFRIYDTALSDEEIGNLYLYNSLEEPLAPPPQPVTETMEDVGAGVGGLLSGMGTPLTVLIILLGVASAFGFIIATMGQRVGARNV